MRIYGLRREPKGSALPKFASSVSDGGMVSRLHWFAASLRPVELLAPCTDLTRDFPSQLGLLLPGFRWVGRPSRRRV